MYKQNKQKLKQKINKRSGIGQLENSAVMGKARTSTQEDMRENKPTQCRR